MMMTAISPHVVNMEETIGTLRYALRAKAIVCSAKVNEEKSTALVQNMKEEIMKLQMQLKSGGGGGGSGEMSEELKREIEEREREIEQVEEEFKQKEEVMKQQIDTQLIESEELKVTIHQRKHQQFADAFRNAFSIKRNKDEIISANKLLEVTTAQAQALQLETARMEKEATQMRKKHEDEDAASKREISSLQRAVTEKGQIITETNTKLAKERDTVADLERRNAALLTAKKEVDRKLQIVREELVELKTSLERDKNELSKSRDADQVSFREMGEARDAIRRRKEAWVAAQLPVLQE